MECFRSLSHRHRIHCTPSHRSHSESVTYLVPHIRGNSLHTKMYQTHEHHYTTQYGAQPPPPGMYGPPPPYGPPPVTQQPPPGTTVYVVPAQQEQQSSGISAGQALCCGCCVGYCLACSPFDICCCCF